MRPPPLTGTNRKSSLPASSISSFAAVPCPAITCGLSKGDRKSTRLNSSHTVIYTLSLHDALPISAAADRDEQEVELARVLDQLLRRRALPRDHVRVVERRSEEHTSELQSHSDLHSFPTRRSSDLRRR